MAWARALLLISPVFWVGRIHAEAACASDDMTCIGEAGDDISALQLRAAADQQEGQPNIGRIIGRAVASIAQPDNTFRDDQRPPEDSFWELIPIDSVAEVLPWDEPARNNPSCLQGLMFMDQKCLTYPQLPAEETAALPCSGDIYAENEYTTAFGPFNGTCFRFERSAWTFGSGFFATFTCSGDGPLFCQKNSDTHGPCDMGAYYDDGGEFGLEVREWGFDRPTFGKHYPLLQIVDPQGNKTKWWDSYVAEVSRTKCPPGVLDTRVSLGPLGCRRSQWAKEGLVGHCKRPYFLPTPAPEEE